MRVAEISTLPSVDETDELVRFVEEVETESGARPLSDHLWLDLRSGGSDGFAAVTIRDEDAGLLAMAQVSTANDGSLLEAFVRGDVADGRTVLDDATETAIDAFAVGGGGRLVWWVDDPDDHDVAFARQHGFEAVRELAEMRRELPLDERAVVPTRAFRPGVDDDAWLRVNNRAFADHGEQGGWTLDTLRLRMAEPWFDPEGFRVHDVDGQLAAFCWTKLHHEADPVLGEIYVIAVDPDHHGRGLGKQLTLAGLDAIAARGVTHANLYVDTANEPAVRLYERLGFQVHRRRRAFATTR